MRWMPRRMRHHATIASVMVLIFAGAGCFAPAEESGPRTSFFIGIDVSGSFEASGRYDDALAFAARYIHAHLNGYGDLQEPRALFVGSIGGDAPDQTQGFHPIHDFEDKSIDEIERDLRTWFPPTDQLTDFNSFFSRVSDLAKRYNLVLTPVNVLVFSDGVPDVGTGRGDSTEERYATIDLSSLEYLSRNVTVRLLYPDPEITTYWENDVNYSRVRMWTVDSVVMNGWREQVEPNSAGPAAQTELWRWIKDNVDFRVRRGVL